MIKIRRATLKDYKELARLRWLYSLDQVKSPNQSEDDFTPNFKNFLKQAIVREEWIIWVAEDKKKLIANAYFYPVYSIPRPGNFHRKFGLISNVFVLPDYRNKGLGSKLIKHVIQWAKKEKFESLVLWHTERSISFYKRAGFEENKNILEYRFK